MLASDEKYELIYKMLNDILLEEGIYLFETIIIKTIAVFIERTISNKLKGIKYEARKKPTLEELQKAAKLCNEVPLPIVIDSTANICDGLEIK